MDLPDASASRSHGDTGMPPTYPYVAPVAQPEPATEPRQKPATEQEQTWKISPRSARTSECQRAAAGSATARPVTPKPPPLRQLQWRYPTIRAPATPRQWCGVHRQQSRGVARVRVTLRENFTCPRFSTKQYKFCVMCRNVFSRNQNNSKECQPTYRETRALGLQGCAKSQSLYTVSTQLHWILATNCLQDGGECMRLSIVATPHVLVNVWG